MTMPENPVTPTAVEAAQAIMRNLPAPEPKWRLGPLQKIKLSKQVARAYGDR